MDGTATTVNPFGRLALSAPVVSVTFRGPAAAPAAMEILAIAAVGPVTLTVLTAMPPPNSAAVTPSTKFVNWPVIATSSVVPWTAWLGVSEVSTGAPAVTVRVAVLTTPPSVALMTVDPTPTPAARPRCLPHLKSSRPPAATSSTLPTA